MERIVRNDLAKYITTNPLLLEIKDILLSIGVSNPTFYKVKHASRSYYIPCFSKSLNMDLNMDRTCLTIPIRSYNLIHQISNDASLTKKEFFLLNCDQIRAVCTSSKTLKSIPVVFSDLINEVCIVFSDMNIKDIEEYDCQNTSYSISFRLGLAVPLKVHDRVIVKCKQCPKRLRCNLQPQECNLYLLNRQARL